MNRRQTVLFVRVSNLLGAEGLFQRRILRLVGGHQ